MTTAARVSKQSSWPLPVTGTCLTGAVTCLLAIVPHASHAQSIRALIMSRLNDGGSLTVTTLSGRPDMTDAPGYLALLDHSGREVGRAIHNAAGPVVIEAPEPGEYRLQSQRVGYESVTSAPFRLRAGQIIDMTIDAAREPVQLNVLSFLSSSCRQHADRDPVLRILWEEIRKAISAVTWTGGHVFYVFQSSTFDRTVDVAGRVASERTMAATGPVFLGSTAPPAAGDGYTATHDEGTRSFLATGRDYLLSEAFQEDYCFVIVEGPPDVVGLRFAPANARDDVADVTGTFWVDRATDELRLLEYHAVNLPYDPEDRTGGMIRLLRVPSGRWVVSEWKTRTPVLQRDGGRERLLQFRDRGGLVSRIGTAEGEVVHEARVGELRGMVVDEGASPVRDATVALVGTPYATVTGGNGRFTITGYFEGDYAVSLIDVELPAVGGDLPEEVVALAPGRIATVQLVIPTSTSIRNALCVGEDSAATRGIITGIVRDDQSGAVLVGARIVARTGNDEISTLADSTGLYTICDVTPDVPVELFAQYDGRVTSSVTLTFVDGGVHRETRQSNTVVSEYLPTTSLNWNENFQVVPMSHSSPPATIGFKFGIASTTVAGVGINAETVGGFHGSMFYENYGNYLGWRVEGGYVKQGAYSPADRQRMILHYLRIPILVAFRTSRDESRLLTPFFLGGPAFGFETRGNRGVPKGDISVVLGGGVRIRMGAFAAVSEVTYGFGLTSNDPPPLHELPELATVVPRFFRGTEFKNRVFMFSVGLAYPLRRGVVRSVGSGVTTGRSPVRDVISRAEIDATDVATAFELVQRLHPQWLRSRGQVTMRGANVQEAEAPEAGPVVYFNDSRRGDVEELRAVAVQSVVEILHFNGRDASFRFGPGHGAGVIQVITR